jgi:hypothetical protein
MAETRFVDQAVIKFTQVLIVGWIVAAGALQAPGLVLLLTAAMSVGAASPSRSLFRWIYQHLAVPLGIARPRLVADDPAPHRFAHGLGAAVLAVSTFALLVGARVLGWLLAGLVAALALLNVTAGFCAGCFVYYQLARRGWLPRRPRGA